MIKKKEKWSMNKLLFISSMLAGTFNLTKKKMVTGIILLTIEMIGILEIQRKSENKKLTFEYIILKTIFIYKKYKLSFTV